MSEGSLRNSNFFLMNMHPEGLRKWINYNFDNIKFSTTIQWIFFH